MEEDILNDIEGYPLDYEQRQVVMDSSDSLLVVAAAGSGKTLTIIGKIRYLIEIQKVPPEEILCLSFTNDTVTSLKRKLKEHYNYNVSVFTFHKLSLEILKGDSFSISSSDYLSYTVHEYFLGIIEAYPKLMRYLLLYFHKSPFSLKNYQKLKKESQFEELILELISTISRMKAEKLSKEELFSSMGISLKERFLRKLLYILLNEYEIELRSQGLIDFDDMIELAYQKVKLGNIKKYQYILIDEYQDTSNIRFSLVQVIKKQTGAKLMVVGDDFQSIYRFSGCKLELFTNFSKYFPEAHTLKLENTYRNSQELIDIAGSFILKNKKQLRKNLKSEKRLLNPVRIIWYQNEKEEFLHLISTLFHEGKKNIMILGRNNRDIEEILSNEFDYQNGTLTWKIHPEMNLYYKTVHRSKGLEEETVIVIHLEHTRNGFPNLKKESRIVRKLFRQEDTYLYSEERRLFYVALTRTKNEVYLLSSKKRPSLFVLELKNMMNKKCK